LQELLGYIIISNKGIRYLGSTNDSSKRSLGNIYCTLEIVQLLLEEESCNRWGQEGSNSLGGAVSAVSSAESIVHEEVGIGSLLRKSKCKFRHKNEDTITSLENITNFLANAGSFFSSSG
jgi:hypothetical protein